MMKTKYKKLMGSEIVTPSQRSYKAFEGNFRAWLGVTTLS